VYFTSHLEFFFINHPVSRGKNYISLKLSWINLIYCYNVNLLFLGRRNNVFLAKFVLSCDHFLVRELVIVRTYLYICRPSTIKLHFIYVSYHDAYVRTYRDSLKFYRNCICNFCKITINQCDHDIFTVISNIHFN